jgi:hypothetical protein
MLSQTVRAHPRLSLLAAATLVVVFVVAGYAYMLLEEAGDLPWQTDPTRISEGIVPFQGLFETATATSIATETSTATP